MNLKVLLPFKILIDADSVSRIVAETPDGSFGLLPHRLDCVAAVEPGILTFEIEGENESYLAVDEGILVKTGPDVVVSVRRAVAGSDLVELRHLVDQSFLNLDAQEQGARSVTEKLEAGFVRRFANFEDDPHAN